MPNQETESDFIQRLRQKGITRRDFLKYCSLMAGVLALPPSAGAKISKALETKKRLPVLWLEMQDCAGCSEAFLRASHPSTGDLLLDSISLDYHETIMAASGTAAESSKQKAIKAGGYLLAVEGAIPAGVNGIYCCVGGKTGLDQFKEAASNAVAIIAVGNCAAFGGIPMAAPNPTGAVPISQLVSGKPVLNLPGCPVNAVNLVATVVYYQTFGKLPPTDAQLRPLFAYGHRIHDNCERRGHFDAGEFVTAWGDAGHRAGWCLYKMGCKGPVSFHNCPVARYNDGANWPVGAGHGCIGCSEKAFWELPIYQTVSITGVTPPSAYAAVGSSSKPIQPGAAGVAGGALGLMVGAAATLAVTQLKHNGGNPDAGSDRPLAGKGNQAISTEQKTRSLGVSISGSERGDLR